MNAVRAKSTLSYIQVSFVTLGLHTKSVNNIIN